ncbi:hypothetical protein Drorol1_Dr00019083 [Drosera rotundifolia]
MASGLDMSLDDLIKNSKTTATRGGGATRNRVGIGAGGVGFTTNRSGPGAARRFPNRPANRPAPYVYPKAPEGIWTHDFVAHQAAAAAAAAAVAAPGGSIETGTKLYISNLDYGVSNEDIRELFAEVGDLKKYSVHYDRSGRSKGTAEVVYSRRMDALAAVKRYNNVELDGKPMKIEIVGTNITAPPLLPLSPPVFPSFPNPGWAPPRMPQGRGGVVGQAAGGSGFGRGRGRGNGNSNGRTREKVSAEQLDAELDKYHSESMQET